MAKVADPAPSASLALVSSARHDHPRPTYRLHGTVLWLAGSLLAWVRTWDASAAAHRARSSLVGCKDMVLITTAVRWQYGTWRGKLVLQAWGAAPSPPLGAVSFNGHWCWSWWPLDDHGHRQATFLLGQVGRRESSRGLPEVVFCKARSGRCCCFCLQGMLRCHHRDMLAACGRPNRLSRPLHVRVRVTEQNPEPGT